MMRPDGRIHGLSGLPVALLLFLLWGCSEGSAPTSPEPEMRTLTVELSGSGSGTITSAPSGIQCGGGGTACSATFPVGQVVTLTAASEATSRFAAWGSDCEGRGQCQVEMSGNRSATARFQELTAPTEEHGVVEGFLFLDPSAPGGLRILRSGDDGGGLVPAAGATVALAGASGPEIAHADGYFRLGDLPPGPGILSLEAESVSREVALTIYPDAVASLGETPILRTEASELALAAVPSVATTDDVWLLGPQQPISAGVALGEALQGDDGRPEEALATESWLFYLDANPSARFQKVVRFILVDAASGAVTIREALSWPTLNGRQFYGNQEANSNSLDLIRGPSAAAPSASPRALDLPSSFQDEAATGQTFGIVIQGANDTGFPVDADNVHDLITQQLGGTAEEYRPPRSGDGMANPIGDITRWFRESCGKAGPDDTLIISLHGHGTMAGSVQLQDASNDDGTRAGYVPWHPETLPWSECTAGRIIIMADLCFSGELANRMQAYVERFPEHFGGREVIILASAAEDEYAGGAGRADQALGLAPGGYFTSKLLANLGAASTLPTNTLLEAAAEAGREVAEITAEDGLAPFNSGPRLGQNAPAPWNRPMAPGETLHPDGTATQWGVRLLLPVAGTVDVPLANIQGYFIAAPHVPVTADFGCEYTHIHSDDSLGPRVILVTWPGLGTVPVVDPAPSHCGFGRLLDIEFP